jgi:UDP-glucose 4-epimerase
MGIKWLITGGCGFIGRNLVNNLVAEGGYHIRIVDNLSASTREDLAQVCTFTEIDPSALKTQSSALSPQSLPPAVELIVADILDADLALKASQGMDIIVHLAANTGVAPSVEDPRADCMNNVIGTLNYLEAARHNDVRKFVFASSGAPVGECEPPIHEEIAPQPVSPYGASKLAGEGYCSAYYRTFGVKTVALRFGNVYGPLSGHKDSVVAKFIKHAIDGKTLEIYGDGTQTRDFIYVDDLIRAIRLSVDAADTGGEIFQIATNRETTINELVEDLLPILSDAGLRDIDVQNSQPRQGDVKRNFSDTSKAKKILHWRSEVSLSEGLGRTVQWYLKGP